MGGVSTLTGIDSKRERLASHSRTAYPKMDKPTPLPADDTNKTQVEERMDTSLTVENICDIFDTVDSEEQQYEHVLSKIIDEVDHTKLQNLKAVLRKEIMIIRSKYQAFLHKYSRKKERVRQNHQKFMSAKLRLPVTLVKRATEELARDPNPPDELAIDLVSPQDREKTPPKVEIPGTSKSQFEIDERWTTLSKRTKRRKVTETEAKLENVATEAAVFAVERKAREGKKESLAKLLKLAMTSPLRPLKILESIQTEKVQVTNLSPEIALALVLTKHVTRDLYQTLRNLAIQSGLKNYYPPYDAILEEKKKCRPIEGPNVTEVQATISLQSLLNHTASRIVDLQDEVLIAYAKEEELDEIKLTLRLSWGFDGSTGQSIYKQKMDGPGDDHSLFATTIIPLVVETETQFYVWKNKTPQSFRSCRPLSLKYVKESDSVIQAEKERVESEIASLQPYIAATSTGIPLTVNFSLYLTVIDGKVYSIITGASSQQSCGICGAKPSQLNNIDACKDNIINLPALTHGISPLHMWIRCLEFVLHLGYKNVDGLRKYKGDTKSSQYRTRKKSIQDKMKLEFGLLLDVPRAGGAGTSNDGNTARRLFADANRRKAAEILGLEHWLLDGLHTLLVALECSLPVDSKKFGMFCYDLAQRYKNEYGWYYLPVSIHKLLVHGKDIMEASVLPLGILSEQAGESQNKMYKRYREHHSRKDSRIHTLTDLFNRCLDASDPRICQYKLDNSVRRTKNLALPQEVRDMLQDQTAHFSRNILEESSIDVITGSETTLENLDNRLSLQAELNPENGEGSFDWPDEI